MRLTRRHAGAVMESAQRAPGSDQPSKTRSFTHVRGHKNRRQAIQGRPRRTTQSRTDTGGGGRASVVLDQVLMVGEGDSIRLGQPIVAGATVTATVVAQGRGEKVKIFKMRRRKHYQKHQGHRQNYTELKIEAIVG